MVIWKLSQAYEYLGNGAYLKQHNFNYLFVYKSYMDSFCKKQKIFTVGGLKRFRLRKYSTLKGHGNEADFLGFLQKLGPHRSLTLPFEPFRYWLRIRGDNRNRKTTCRLGESASRGVADSPTWRVGESTTRRVGESTTRRVGESVFECLKEKLG
jgi:hypothetical protein